MRRNRQRQCVTVAGTNTDSVLRTTREQFTWNLY